MTGSRDSSGLPADAGGWLLSAARAALAQRLDLDAPPVEADPQWARRPGASFVTLTQQGQLRGCIGSLEAHRPLEDDVRANAVSAGLRDPRFRPLAPDELARTDIEVSVLSAPEPMAVTSEDDALRQLRPGTDGVVLSGHGRRGTFLPQVWEQLPEPRDFLAHLVRKAGLPAGAWDPSWQLSRYTVTAYTEDER